MEYKFIQQQKLTQDMNELFEQWDARYKFFNQLTKKELSEQVKITEKEVRESLSRRDIETARERIAALGAVLDKTHNHFQDLGMLYSKMWNLIENSTIEE